jgi:hypothetical protein
MCWMMPTSIARALLLARLNESRELIHHHLPSMERGSLL